MRRPPLQHVDVCAAATPEAALAAHRRQGAHYPANEFTSVTLAAGVTCLFERVHSGACATHGASYCNALRTWTTNQTGVSLRREAQVAVYHSIALTASEWRCRDAGVCACTHMAAGSQTWQFPGACCHCITTRTLQALLERTLVPVAQSPATARMSCCIVAQYAHMGSTPRRNGFSICTQARDVTSYVIWVIMHFD